MRFLILLLLCLSCGDDNFPKVEKLDSFRILGIIASASEVAPGGSSNLQVIVSDVSGTAPTISGTYETCIDPGIGRGAPVACPVVLQSGAYDLTFGTLLPSPALRTGVNALTLNVTAPAGILTGRSAREQNNGVGLIVIFRFGVNGKEVVAFKRIIATQRAALNANPSITGLFANGTPVTTLPPDNSDFSLTANAPEQYDYINIDGTGELKREVYEVAWYTTAGEFSRPKARVEEKSELKLKSQGPAVFVGILRDERGGVDFAKVAVP